MPAEASGSDAGAQPAMATAMAASMSVGAGGMTRSGARLRCHVATCSRQERHVTRWAAAAGSWSPSTAADS